MSLSDKVEEERQAILARRADEKDARAALYDIEVRMADELHARLLQLVDGLSDHTVRVRHAGHTTSVEMADFRINLVPRRGRFDPTPYIKLTASSSGQGRTWSLSAEDRNIPYAALERATDSARIRNRKLSTSSLDEAVEWFEVRMVRGIAAVQIWQADHPVKVAADEQTDHPPAAPSVDRSFVLEESALIGTQEETPHWARALARKLRPDSFLEWLVWMAVMIFVIAMTDR